MHTFGKCINYQVKLISISLKTVRGVRQTKHVPHMWTDRQG